MTTSIKDINNFADLLLKVGIEIPLIQRDYVQGRIHDTEDLEKRNDDLSRTLLKKYTDEKEKRDAFVKRLINALLRPEDSAIQLTFIYGTVESTTGTSSHHADSFIPLDGQQRLTTLFLLCWALKHKITPSQLSDLEQKSGYQDFIKGLKSIRYMTRPSSEAFCYSLFSEPLADIPEVKSVSAQIQQQSWFGDDWILDPSVQNMLLMLDQMDFELSRFQPSEIILMYDNMISGKGISFELLDMRDYQLKDGLYIKMNARGKQLTKFENWKSEFIGFLDENHTDTLYDADDNLIEEVFGNKKPTLKEYFEYSIEHQWTDLFWGYCIEDITAHEENLKSIEKPSRADLDCYPVIDEYFMRCFYAIHELFYFIDNRSDEPKEFQDTVAQREKTFKNADHVKDLFAYLDLFKVFNDNNIYKDIFFVAEGNQYSHPSDKVRLFDGNEELNLLTRCARDKDFSNIIQIILFAMLRYAKEFGTDVTPEFKSFIRQVRNIVDGGNTFLRTSDVAMTNTLKICQINRINNQIDELLDKTDTLLTISDEYAEIDDFDFVSGAMKPSFLPEDNESELSPALSIVRDVLKAWDAMDEYDKISLFVAYGYGGQKILTCATGDTYMFGKNDRWKTIFMRDQNIEKPLRDIMDDYVKLSSSGICGIEALVKLLKDKRLAPATQYDFNYYMLKYKSFAYSHAKNKDPYVYFAIMGDRNEMDICSIIRSGQPARAYYTNPIIFSVKNELYSQNTSKNKLYLSYITRGGGQPTIDVYETNAWDGKPAIATFKQITGIHGSGGWEYTDLNTSQTQILHDDPTKDRIQAGVEFIRSIFPSNDFAEKG